IVDVEARKKVANLLLELADLVDPELGGGVRLSARKSGLTADRNTIAKPATRASEAGAKRRGPNPDCSTPQRVAFTSTRRAHPDDEETSPPRLSGRDRGRSPGRALPPARRGAPGTGSVRVEGKPRHGQRPCPCGGRRFRASVRGLVRAPRPGAERRRLDR